MRPHQSLHIQPLLTFPTNLPQLLPFAREETPEQLRECLAATAEDSVIHLLLETELQPNYDKGRIAESVRVCCSLTEIE